MAEIVRIDGGPPERRLSLDDVLEAVSNYQRRAVIKHLRESSGHLHSIDEVINHLREIERERQGTGAGEDHLLSVLVHVHGPKLQELGLVEYDVPSMEIRYYPNEKVERMLDEIESASEDFDEW